VQMYGEPLALQDDATQLPPVGRKATVVDTASATYSRRVRARPLTSTISARKRPSSSHARRLQASRYSRYRWITSRERSPT
jgi:hypothetical protein